MEKTFIEFSELRESDKSLNWSHFKDFVFPLIPSPTLSFLS